MIALGDITERCLRFFGVTKERVQAATGKNDCGCVKRQAAMNQWGFRWQYRLALPFYWLLHRWQAVRHGRIAMRLWRTARHLRAAARVLFFGR